MNDRRNGHETGDMSFRTVALFGGGLLALLVIVGLLLVGLFTLIAHTEATSDILPSMVTPTVPPQPRLEVVPGDALQQQRNVEDQQLDTYGWVDRQHNIARIPISRAMDLYAQQATPPQPQGEWF